MEHMIVNIHVVQKENTSDRTGEYNSIDHTRQHELLAEPGEVSGLQHKELL